MPDATLNYTASGWPYLDDQNFIDITDDYTNTLATKLETDVTQLSQDAAAAADAANALAGTFLVGPGRPDVPATTPYTATELNALPIGTEYRSTAGPQGAWRWRKTGATAWVVTDGTTGLRNVDSLFINGWQLGTPTSIGRIRRVGERCDFYTQLRSASATADTFLNLPAGFRDNATNPGTTPSGVIGTPGGAVAGAVLSQYNNGALSTPLRLTLAYWRFSWFTSDPWPTALPGTAA